MVASWLSVSLRTNLPFKSKRQAKSAIRESKTHLTPESQKKAMLVSKEGLNGLDWQRHFLGEISNLYSYQLVLVQKRTNTSSCPKELAYFRTNRSFSYTKFPFQLRVILKIRRKLSNILPKLNKQPKPMGKKHRQILYKKAKAF